MSYTVIVPLNNEEPVYSNCAFGCSAKWVTLGSTQDGLSEIKANTTHEQL